VKEVGLDDDEEAPRLLTMGESDVDKKKTKKGKKESYFSDESGDEDEWEFRVLVVFIWVWVVLMQEFWRSISSIFFFFILFFAPILPVIHISHTLQVYKFNTYILAYNTAEIMSFWRQSRWSFATNSILLKRSNIPWVKMRRWVHSNAQR
jgi:hypothetical protein